MPPEDKPSISNIVPPPESEVPESPDIQDTTGEDIWERGADEYASKDHPLIEKLISGLVKKNMTIS
jgi:hypothetical protein